MPLAKISDKSLYFKFLRFVIESKWDLKSDEEVQEFAPKLKKLDQLSREKIFHSIEQLMSDAC